jgi:oligopeptide transport system substrate-binding protein
LRGHLRRLKLKAVFFSFFWGFASFASPPPFRLHLNIEPTSLKPWEQKNSSAGYFLSQLSGTLLKYVDGKLVPSLAESCTFKTPVLIECKIRKSASFSDDTLITAEDFRRSWIEFLRPKNLAFRADLLFSVKNAEQFFQGKLQETDVGLSVKDGHLLITLSKSDPDFLYALASPLLAPAKNFDYPEPAKAAQWISSGDYVIQSWEPKKKIVLKHRKQDLQVHYVFVQEDATALNLYENGELSFLRRLPTLFIPKFKMRNDFVQVPQNRMDYIGFGPELANHKELRQALSQSLNFSEIQNLLFSKGQYGCPGLPTDQQKEVHCLEFNLTEAKKQLSIAKKKHSTLPRLAFAYSKQGGEDHKLVAEWLQSQWKKHLGLNVEIQPTENKIFLEKLKEKPAAIFRKGVNPERPTCLSALEFFTPESSENFLRLDPQLNKEFFNPLKALQKNPPKAESQRLCSLALENLASQFLWIPTGPIHFTLLVKPEWKGWTLNELNQLDLSGLRYSPEPK